MAYEKYISKNGKLYGPYTYHSKRINGKVVSEYHGTTKKPKNNFLWIVGVFIVAILLAGFIFWNTQFVGRATLDINSNSQVGEILEGVLSLSLKEGELIPASSKVIFDVDGISYEYILSDIINSETTSGNFYVEGKSISGGGVGYGVTGTKKIYPNLDFTLNILSESKAKTNNGDGGNNVPEVVEPVVEEIPEIIEESIEEIIEIEEVEIFEEVTDEIVVEESVETIEISTEETSIISESKQESKSEKNEKVEKKSELESTPEIVVEEVVEPTPETSVTGSVIASFFRNTLNSFLVFTGQVSLKLTQEVDGSTSFGESFTYDLAEGEIAEIKPNSVKIGEEVVNDNLVMLDIINNQVIVTTEYSIEEEGFGADYIGGTGETITIDLSQLNLELGGENILISFIYDNLELVSVSTFLDGEVEEPIEEPIEEIPETNISNQTEQPVIGNETIGNITLGNITDIVNISESNITIVIVEILTDEEKNILENKYGNVSVEITKAEKVKDRIEVTFEIGNYFTKHSYNEGLSVGELSEWIERDKIRLLKDIAEELSKESSSFENVEGLVGSYPI